MNHTIRIDARFCGPPDTGNGGYVGGRLAQYLDGAVEVTLRARVPLDVPLQVVRAGDDVTLRDGERVLASARPLVLELVAPPAPDFAQAQRVAGTCRALETHPFPRCFACGPEREDGLRLLPGPLGDGVVAVPWTPGADLADAAGKVRAPFIWAGLDCTGSFPLLEDEAARALEPMVLGRIAVALEGVLHAGERAVLCAWTLGVEGRRGQAGSALFGESGARLAIARATWVSLAGR